MPCIEASLPRVNRDIKAALAMELTQAFCTATAHPAEIFGIRFFEYDLDSASSGGKLCDTSGTPPYLHLLVYCPRLKRTTKQKMGSALTEAFIKGSGRADWVPVIHISEHPFDNVIIGGNLLSNAYKECAGQKFYYEMPQD